MLSSDFQNYLCEPKGQKLSTPQSTDDSTQNWKCLDTTWGTHHVTKSFVWKIDVLLLHEETFDLSIGINFSRGYPYVSKVSIQRNSCKPVLCGPILIHFSAILKHVILFIEIIQHEIISMGKMHFLNVEWNRYLSHYGLVC